MQEMKLRKFILLVSLLLFTSCTQPQPDPNYVKIDFKNLSIEDFLEKVFEITGNKIVIDQKIKGKINFVYNKPILKSELIPLANAILESKGLILVNKGAYYSIGKSTAKAICYLPIEEERTNESFSTKVFLLERLNGAVARTKIKPLLSKGSKVVYSKLENSLTVTSSSSSLKLIKMLIDKLKEREEQGVVL